MTTILIKKKDTAGAPAPGDLTNSSGGAEIAVNTATKRLYTKDSGGNVVELCTNPSALTTNLLFTPDNTYDIGASGASRPRNLFLGSNLTVGGNSTLGDAAADNVTVNGTITSNLIFTDNTYDIGASGATRPRNLYLAGNEVVAGSVTWSGGTANGIAYLNGSKVASTSSNFTYDGTNTLLSGGYLQVVNPTVTAIFRQSSSTAYTSLRLYNDTNTSGRALEIDYAGSAFATALLSGAATGESASIATVGAYPLYIGTNNAARISIDGSTGFITVGSSTTSFPFTIRKDASNASDPTLYINPNTNTNASVAVFNNGGSGSVYIGRASSTGTGANATLGNYDSFFWNSGSQKIYFGTNNLTAMMIGTDQKITVGSSTAAVRSMDIYGVTGSNPALRLSNNLGNQGIEMITSPTNYSWLLGAQYTTTNTFEITPSTAVGGTTFTTPVFSVYYAGSVGVNAAGATGSNFVVYPYGGLTAGSVTALIKTNATTGQAVLTLDANTSASTSNVNGVYFASSGANKWALGGGNAGSAGANDFSLYNYTASNTVFNILASNSYIGIGTNGPSYPLDIRRDIGSASPMVSINPTTTTNASVLLLNNGGSGSFFVGRTSSTGAGASGASLDASAAFIWHSGAQKLYIGNNDSTCVYFGTNTNAYFTSAVNSGGAGSSMPYGFNGKGPALSDTNNQYGIYFGSYSTSVGLPTFIQNWASPGNFGIGTHTGTNDSIVRIGIVSGSGGGYAWSGAYCNIYAGAYTNASDYRIKENVREIEKTGMLAKIRKLRGIIYNVIPQTIDGVTSHTRDEMGYLAHEAQAIFPLVVTGEKDAVDAEGNEVHQGLDYSRLVVPLAAALTELADAFDAYVASHP